MYAASLVNMLYPPVLFGQVAFSEDVECSKSNIGYVALIQNNQHIPNSEGMVVVCVEVEHPPAGMSNYQPAVVCWNGSSTFNEGAAAAACRQGGYSKQKRYNSSTSTV